MCLLVLKVSKDWGKVIGSDERSPEVVEKNLKWRIHYHPDDAALASALEQAEHPPYFFCVKDRHMLPTEVLKAVAMQGGYFYEGLPGDAFSLFRSMTSTQAWTVACTNDQVKEAEEQLMKSWQTKGLDIFR